jgi:site-specific DNA recombinase
VLEELDGDGVAFESASEPFDTTTAAGRMMVQMLGVFTEFEREMIVERTQMGWPARRPGESGPGGRRRSATGTTEPDGYSSPTKRKRRSCPGSSTSTFTAGWARPRLATCSMTTGKQPAGCRWKPHSILDILRNPTYIGRLPFNGETYRAEHTALVDEAVFHGAQAVMGERSESWRARAANATDYVLTSLLRCQRCGHGFVGISAHGKTGVYRYYTCYARQRHGTARCDQERLPADQLEDAIVAEVLAALDGGEIFQEAARRVRHAWEAAHPGRREELAAVDIDLGECRAVIDRYLRAFEAGRLSEIACAHRLQALEREIAGLAARKAALESQCEQAPVLPADGDLREWRGRIELAVAHAAPEQLKLLLGALVDRISWSRGRASSRTSPRQVFVRLALRGGGRESNPPEQGRCSHRF